MSRWDFRYDDQPERLLEGVTLELHRGEVVAVTGPSGCGKTTLAYIVGSLLEPERGSIKVNGVDLRDIPVNLYRKKFEVVYCGGQGGDSQSGP